MFTSLFQRPNGRPAHNRTGATGRRKARPRPATCTPHLETLESRVVPTGCYFRCPFGPTGIVTTDFVGSVNDRATGVALQLDGRIVAAGVSGNTRLALARYNADGSLDTSFGTGGRVTTDLGSSTLSADVVLQLDGKIVVSGTILSFVGPGDFALVRYNRDGSLDTSFGTGGKVITDFGGDDSAWSVDVQPNGKIVVAGETANFDTQIFGFALARYNANGSLDTSFDTDGKVITDFGGPAFARDVAVRPNGEIVAAGITFDFDTFQENFALARYNVNGSLDTSFDGDGKVTTDFGGQDLAWAVHVRPNGNIVVAGTTFDPDTGSGDFAVARYNANGSLDTSFSTDGKVITDFGGDDQATDVDVQLNGKIVVVGSTAQFDGVIFDWALARYNADGSLDTSFDGDGKVTTDLDGRASANAVAIRLDGKIVVAGNTFSFDTRTDDFAVARYNRDGSLDANPLRAPTGGGGAAQEMLTPEQVQTLLSEAVSRWQVTGLDTSSLGAIQVFVADLPGDLLGLADGNTIWLDANAASWGWFVDATPADDREFATPGGQGEQGRIDLLSVLLHELGHVLGLEHDHEGVMQATLSPGMRLPILDDAPRPAPEIAGQVSAAARPRVTAVADSDAERARAAAVAARWHAPELWPAAVQSAGLWEGVGPALVRRADAPASLFWTRLDEVFAAWE